MKDVKAKVIDHVTIAKMYRILSFQSPPIARVAEPGQFIFLRVPELESVVLRRPFSIFDVKSNNVSILYKIVGKGTKAMDKIRQGEEIDVMGPLGNAFPKPSKDVFPLLVAGGYGIAPLHFLARRVPQRGICFMGAGSKDEILCANTFRKMGWKVIITTEDGSSGQKGRVTDALKDWLESYKTESANSPGKTQQKIEIYACGPEGMLYVIAELANRYMCRAWVSMEAHMGCGVGACLGCVHKLRLENGSTGWVRICHDGPVFESSRLITNTPAEGRT